MERVLSENLTGQTPAARRVFTRLTAGFFPLLRLCRSFHLVSVFHKGKNPITSEGIFAKFSVSLLFFCKAKKKRRFLSENLQDRHRRHAAFLRGWLPVSFFLFPAARFPLFSFHKRTKHASNHGSLVQEAPRTRPTP